MSECDIAVTYISRNTLFIGDYIDLLNFIIAPFFYMALMNVLFQSTVFLKPYYVWQLGFVLPSFPCGTLLLDKAFDSSF